MRANGGRAWLWAMAWSVVSLLVAAQIAYAGCSCILPPTVSIMVDDMVCAGSDFESQVSYDCGQDGKSKARCSDCNDCPPSECMTEVTVSSEVINWQITQQLRPGLNYIVAGVRSCNGSAMEEKLVTAYRVDSATGPGRACAGETKTFSATTNPPGGEQLIWWSVPAPALPLAGETGANFTVQFPRAGYYLVQAGCGETREVGVEVGVPTEASDEQACDPLPEKPDDEIGSNRKEINDDEWYESEWNKVFTWHLVAQSHIGACHQLAQTGVIEIDPGWSIGAGISLSIDEWIGVGFSTSYVPTGSGTFSGFSAGGTHGLQYRVKAYVLMVELQIVRKHHGFSPLFGPWTNEQSASDTYAASPFVPIICRYCCST